MEPFADHNDVATIWRPLTDAEVISVEAWIAEASQQVRDEVPDVDGLDVDERITAGTLSPVTVRSVVARMVRRLLMNPGGDSSITEQTGPFSVTRTKSKSNAGGDLFISVSEMRRLMGRRDSVGQQAFTISPGPGPVFPVAQRSW